MILLLPCFTGIATWHKNRSTYKTNKQINKEKKNKTKLEFFDQAPLASMLVNFPSFQASLLLPLRFIISHNCSFFFFAIFTFFFFVSVSFKPMDPHTHTHTVEMEVDTNTPTKKQEKKKKRETLNRRNTPFFENGQYYRSYGSRKQRRGHQEKKKKRGRKKGNSSLFLFSSLFKCSRSCKPTDNVAERRGKIQALCMYAGQKSTLQYTNKKAHNHIRSSERDIVCSGKKKKEYLHS